MHLWHDIGIGDSSPKEIIAIIEIPKGTARKYELDLKTGKISLDILRPFKRKFPFNYGFIPQTIEDDGDPLDIIALHSGEKLKRGAKVRVIPLAMLQVIDNGLRDNKILAIPATDAKLKRDLTDIKNEIGYFFKTYKEGVTIKRWLNKTAAHKEIIKCSKKYQKKFGQG